MERRTNNRLCLLSIVILIPCLLYLYVHYKRVDIIYTELNDEHDMYLSLFETCKIIAGSKNRYMNPFRNHYRSYSKRFSNKYTDLKKDIDFQIDNYSIYKRSDDLFDKMKGFQDFISKEVMIGGLVYAMNMCQSYSLSIDDRKQKYNGPGIYVVPLNQRFSVAIERYTLNTKEQKIDTLRIERELLL